MKRVRSAKRAGSGEMEEEVAMWAVLANAVDVQVGEGAAPGIAVYGPGFSWLDHNCSPNACYRFEPTSPSRSSVGPLVSPAGAEEPPEMWEIWIGDESKLIQGLTIYGPRITVRSIKPIKKGEEVSITYIDLLQPKATRHLDLWLKYRFICCCKRCVASPEMYIDYILNCDARNIDSNHEYFRDADCKELDDFLDQTISEFMSDGSPEACCEKIENLLSKIFQYCQFQEPSTFLLHPLHYLSLNAYLTLASAYRILGSNMIDTAGLGEGDTQEAFKMRRAAAAYSLLLAGATHHLFLSEPSLITSTTVFWVSAGESIMDLVRSSCGLDLGLVSHNSRFMPVEDPFASMADCKATSMRFHECMLSHLTRSWMYLVEGFSYLENIESPIDFSWLGKITKILTGGKSTDLGKHFEYRCRPETCFEEEMRVLIQLAVYCLTYGRYLANICYGPQCYLSDKVGNLLSIRSLGTG